MTPPRDERTQRNMTALLHYLTGHTGGNASPQGPRSVGITDSPRVARRRVRHAAQPGMRPRPPAPRAFPLYGGIPALVRGVKVAQPGRYAVKNAARAAARAEAREARIAAKRVARGMRTHDAAAVKP